MHVHFSSKIPISSLYFATAHYERLFKNIQSQVQGEAVTGLLLIYPVHVVHIVEVGCYDK